MQGLIGQQVQAPTPKISFPYHKYYYFKHCCKVMGNSQQSQGGVNPGSAIDFINSAESAASNLQGQDEQTNKNTRTHPQFIRCLHHLYVDTRRKHRVCDWHFHELGESHPPTAGWPHILNHSCTDGQFLRRN